MNYTFVIIGNGLTLPADAVLLAFTLQRRGLHLCRDGDYLAVGPPALLTDRDRAELRRWRWHLLDLIDHDERDHPRPQ